MLVIFNAFIRLGLKCICLLYLSACANISKAPSNELEILTLSEKEFIIVARANEGLAYNKEDLESKIIQRARNYALSKNMMPVVTNKSIQKPSEGEAGYLKYQIKLIEWSEAQTRLNNDHYVADIDLSYSEDTNSDSTALVSANTTHSNKNEVVTENPTINQNCIDIEDKYEKLLGQSLGDLCQGHSLSYDLYVELEESNCESEEYAELKQIAQTGYTQNCKDGVKQE